MRMVARTAGEDAGGGARQGTRGLYLEDWHRAAQAPHAGPVELLPEELDHDPVHGDVHAR